MAFLTRSVTCIVVNKTKCPLRLSTSKLLHGSLDTPIPSRIPAGGTGKWTSSTAGAFTGTEGWAVFELEGADAMFEVDWNNPFVGTNSFKQSFRLLPDVLESPAGTYVPAEPTGEDLEDADDVIVTFSLTMEPPPPAEVSASAGGAASTEPAPPPPDEDAPQVVSAQPGVENHASGIGVLAAPRLSVALNAVDPGDTGTDTSIDATLALIAKRLEGGLDVVWKKGAAMGLWDTTKWKETDPEEQWARTITELLLGLPYNGSAAVYGHPNKDTIFYKPFGDPASNPIVPLAAACQHLVSLGVLSRGFTVPELGNAGFSCNDASSFSAFKGGKWFRDREKRSISKAIDVGLEPGSLYVFNPSPTSLRQLEGSHIAFVLRVDKDQKQAQFFDTGGLNHPERRSGPVPEIMKDGAGSGSYDEPLWDVVSTSHYIGMGILRPPTALADQVARLKKARPVGFARLVMTTRGAQFSGALNPKKPPPQLLFVSRLLRTYGDAEDQNFTLARYYWSLRNLPNTRDVQTCWIFYTPLDAPVGQDTPPERKTKLQQATTMMSGSRATKVDDLGLPLRRKRLLILGSLADGKVKQVQRVRTRALNNKPGETGPPRSIDEELPEGAFPASLLRMIDALPPKETIDPSGGRTLPPLFLDYAAPAAQ
ncbi:hypothetical protein [Sorangium cellulosum]|uniref:Uncharacterized protein n=1 Tax=Sorangium cellulosum So0157-2 TaxID=1254432 RepID=S4Y4V2_SORCE|nr:hypothetical protein [Sorangium cellulosum]AGP39451.1 hypothetical protein SCE1572_36190 [Sorangium cellulosum So0157-2]